MILAIETACRNSALVSLDSESQIGGLRAPTVRAKLSYGPGREVFGTNISVLMGDSKNPSEPVTPKLKPVDKRRRVSSTPDSPLETETSEMQGSSKVGDMTNDELMGALSSLLDSKLASVATKQDITSLSDELGNLKAENIVLRNEIENIRNKLEDLENRSRRNNLIFRGIKYTVGGDYRKVVRDFCVGMLQCQENIWVNRAHPLGGSGLLIAHFPDDGDINYIMSNTKNLKGTGYYVYRDFSKEVRRKRGKLMAVRREIERLKGRRRMPLIFDHLVIENQRYTWTGDRLMTGNEDGCEKLKELLDVDLSDFVRNLKDDQGPRRIGDMGVTPATTTTKVD